MKIVTGFRGENHITSNDDQGRNQGIFGTGSYVLPVRSRFQSTLVSANELQIGDGEGVMQGVHFRTEPTSTDSITIENGSQGMKRIDLVCVRYEKAPETNIENVSWVIHTGEPSESNPQTPSYTQGDILAGDTVAEMPMYKINLDGITVTSVQPQYEILTSAEGLIELLGDSNISGIGDGTVTGAISSLNANLANKVIAYTLTKTGVNIPANGTVIVDFERTDAGSYTAFTVICATQGVVTMLYDHTSGRVRVRLVNLDSTAKNNVTVHLRVGAYNS